MRKFKKLSLTLALLITAVTGAWAQYEFSSDPYTSTTEFNSVSVTSSMTLTINKGVIVTVNSGLTIEDGVTLTLTGGGRLSVFGKSGNWGRDASYEEGNRIYEATAGGDGKPAIILNGNAQIVIDNGEIYAEGGQGGRGGEDATAGINQPDGAAGNAFSRFPTIDGATLYYKSSDEWFKYTSGDKTLYREMKAVPPTFDVTLNDDKTEASFEMPTYDVDFSYELVRDMSVSMTTKIGDGNDGYRIRLKKNEQTGKYEPAEMTVQQMMALVKVHDAIENQDLTFGVLDANCIVNIYAANENNEATGDPIAFPDLTPGRYIAKAVAATGSAYEGETGMSNIFELYEGYQVVIPAGEYVTYYKDEAVRLEEKDKNDIELCTITAVEDGKAVLSDNFDAMKASTPFLLKNTTNEEKTILLIPCNEPDLAVTVADEFIGTLTAKEFTEDDMATDDFYVCNGKEFIKVRGAGTLAPNKAYLKVTGNAPASIPFRRSIDGEGEGTTGISEEVRVKSEEFATAPYYDLNGRKLQGKPTQKGVYIQNGKKVVVK